METTIEVKTRRPRRSKADIEAAIQKAAISQIRKKGFAGALVTDIVKKAKIEPIVFYNRFKNLEEFYDSFVKRYDYWISSLARTVNPQFTSESDYARAMAKLFEALLADGMMVELLRWEVADGTPITQRTATLRELDFVSIISTCAERFPGEDVDCVAVSALVVAGIYFMILHKDRSTFGGIDINTDEGRERVQSVFKQLGRMMFSDVKAQRRRQKLRECLSREGMSAEAIERCLKEIDEEK